MIWLAAVAVSVVEVLMFLGGLDYAFGIHWLGVDHRKPGSYMGALPFFALTLLIHMAWITFFSRRRSPPVGDDWLLWYLRAENEEQASSP